ncbi:SDR family NAD(P)-dependent oxidoreductase [Saliterribacillus persicus]|uniref:NAD(P)-dependent dehydrogenase (Short-subunit alcohol dehydrogenase family) n=1 Tax=Saliterribacillus persicus TaxID=930114 RepID=A0A368XUC2_9BACI|nr:SDR family oxidoreductase [Saliterribacillus persicus]RCW69624.1 hypothetical protein DFR57_10712 [Saliterribacillus persicus]
MTYHEKVVIVTGGANGIGAAIAKEYEKEGAIVIIADVDQENGEVMASEFSNIHFIEADMKNPEAIQGLIDTTLEKFKHIDILINNAGVSTFKSFFDVTVAEWEDVLNTNLRAAFLCTQAAAKHMQHAAIVNIASTRAFMSEADTEAYAASKGGIFALTHAMAITLQEKEITVNAISPGWIATSDYKDLRDIDHKQHPSKRVGKPEDVARACLFLTDPNNNFITGENIVIDGGMTRKMIYEH